MTLKVLQINTSDVVGSRFNNFDIRHLLAAEGVESAHLVWNKLSNSPDSRRFFDLPGARLANKVIGRLESMLSIHSRLQWQAYALALSNAYRTADIVHFHIIHDGYFSLDALRFLTRGKPSVWTWHDPWPMTGHCIYSLECERWQKGCGQCPSLDLPFAMRKDRTAEQFAWKKRVVAESRAQIVVASSHMRDMAARSPIAAGQSIEVIPFGIDLKRFHPVDPQPAQARLGVLPGRLVIGVRAFADSPYKGFEYVVEALRRLPNMGVPLTILTTHGKGHLNEFIGRHQVIDLGWVNDDATMMDSFAATDIFLMPSTAEAFGMMAIEALAFAKPIIVFEGTALPEVAGAPDVAIATPMRDAASLAEAIERLVRSPDERQRRGAAGRRWAETHYSDGDFARKMAALYRKVAQR
ncbi:glycosyltransferase [Bosea sp. BIWAKO-01]|uniref:glycosyltransferase n=1 Tax=Bosea sp. BIWAKO-01 TaxID=506668 RepID=UPI0008692A2C|nr:glycosyltransferase [Bosea sp. BIWAKO-01]GAU83434.1 glycosyltransferase [Bosea sp. BIWAKO-01]